MNTRCKPTPEPSRERGFSMIELVFVLAFMGVVLVGLFQVINVSQRGLLNSENRADLTVMGQRVSQNLRVSLGSSQLLFVDPANSPGLFASYRALLNASVALSPSRAPLIAPWALPPILPPPSALIKPDPAWGAYFGNCIAFSAGIKPLTITVNTAAGVKEIISLDRFQFVLIYPGRFADQIVAGFSGPAPAPQGATHLVEWRSAPIISYPHLSNQNGARLLESAKALTLMGYTLAWDPGVADASKAFYQIDGSGSPVLKIVAAPSQLNEHSWARMIDFDTVQTYQIALDKPVGRARSFAGSGGVSGYRSIYTLAYNSVSPTSNAAYKTNRLLGSQSSALQVPAFAQLDRGGVLGFPGGVELLVGGQGGSREIFGRVVMMASSAATKGVKEYIAGETLVYASVRNPY